MKVYFGKELRVPICEALKLITAYLDKEFDIKESTLASYESHLSDNETRTRTLYAITDSQPEQWEWTHDLYNCFCGGYLGSTELECGIYDNNWRLFDNDRETYRYVEYIKSTGTQYIVTDIVPTYDMKMELDIKLGGTVKTSSESAATRCMFGYYNSPSGSFTIFADDDYDSGAYDWASFYVGYQWYSGQPWEMQIKNIDVTVRTTVIAQRGTSYWGNRSCTTDRTITEPVPSVGMAIFAAKNYNYGIDIFGRRDMYLYGFKVYDGQTLLHDLRPAERARDGELGLLDVETDKFYTNAGTGTFEKGNYIQ